jgi:hypothetical protein
MIVDMLGAIERKPHQELVSRKEYPPLPVKKEAVCLKSIPHRFARAVPGLQSYDLLKERQPYERRLPSLPAE